MLSAPVAGSVVTIFVPEGSLNVVHRRFEVGIQDILEVKVRMSLPVAVSVSSEKDSVRPPSRVLVYEVMV